jgi:hypothetical protein
MEPSSPIEHLVDALLQSFGQLAILLEHMSEWAARNPAPDAEPVPAVLRALLAETLAPLADGADAAAVLTAARMISAATATIGAELHLVSPDAIAECESRSLGGRRRVRGETR